MEQQREPLAVWIDKALWLYVILMGLSKLLGLISISWWWVFTPHLAILSLFPILLIFAIIKFVISEIQHRRRFKEFYMRNKNNDKK